MKFERLGEFVKKHPILASGIVGIMFSTSVHANQTIMEYTCVNGFFVANGIPNGNEGGSYKIHEDDHVNAAKTITSWRLMCPSEAEKPTMYTMLQTYGELRAYALQGRYDILAAVGGAMIEETTISSVDQALPELRSLVAAQDENNPASTTALENYMKSMKDSFIAYFQRQSKILEHQIKNKYQKPKTLITQP